MAMQSYTAKEITILEDNARAIMMIRWSIVARLTRTGQTLWAAPMRRRAQQIEEHGPPGCWSRSKPNATHIVRYQLNDIGDVSIFAAAAKANTFYQEQIPQPPMKRNLQLTLEICRTGAVGKTSENCKAKCGFSEGDGSHNANRSQMESCEWKYCTQRLSYEVQTNDCTRNSWEKYLPNRQSSKGID